MDAAIGGEMSHEVLVLLATWNGADFLAEQLASIAQQTHHRWRIVASDDGSTDRTVEILEQFSHDHPGRLELIAGSSSGSAKENFFQLLRRAPESVYYAFCDQDDVWVPEKLSILVAECIRLESFTVQPVPCVVYSDLTVVDQTLKVIAPSFMRQIVTQPESASFGSLLVENLVPGCTMLLNHALREEFLSYDGPLDDAVMHDWWIALLASSLGRFAYVPTPLVLYRQHSRNVMGSIKRSGLRFALGKLRTPEDGPTRAIRQGILFERAYRNHVPDEISRILQAFTSLPHHGKLARIRACLRYGILKQTTARRVYQFIRI